MRKIFTIILATFILGCAKDKKQIALSDLNLFLKTDIEIDSVFVSNITQDREFQYITYSDAVRVKLKDSINDLYNVWFYSKGKQYSGQSEQLWLNGENVIIKGTFNQKLEIDTVIGSDLYYKSVSFRKNLKKLYKKKSNDTLINNFLLEELKKNLDNPFSIEIVENLFYRNISDKNKLKELYAIIKNQNDDIKNHRLSTHKKIEKILRNDKIDLSQFQLYDTNGNITKIDIKTDKSYLLDFWFINCPPCIKDHKLIAKKMSFLNDKNIELLGISIDKNQVKWEKYLSKNNYNWRNFRELNDSKSKITNKMVVSVFPTYVLVDNNGYIKHRTNSFKEIETYLNK